MKLEDGGNLSYADRRFFHAFARFKTRKTQKTRKRQTPRLRCATLPCMSGFTTNRESGRNCGNRRHCGVGLPPSLCFRLRTDAAAGQAGAASPPAGAGRVPRPEPHAPVALDASHTPSTPSSGTIHNYTLFFETLSRIVRRLAFVSSKTLLGSRLRPFNSPPSEALAKEGLHSPIPHSALPVCSPSVPPCLRGETHAGIRFPECHQ